MATAHRSAVGRGGFVAVITVLFVLSTTPLASAGVGDPLILGQRNTAAKTTYLNWDVASRPKPNVGLAVNGVQVGGVFATSEDYVGGNDDSITGVEAYGNDKGGYFYGVDVGAEAHSEYAGVVASGGETGVSADGDTAVQATGESVGVDVTAPVAIRAQGAVSFSSAGLVHIAAGATSATATPGTDVTGSSMVLATAQSPGGQVLRVSRNGGADTITIFLTAPATQAVTVAYFVIG